MRNAAHFLDTGVGHQQRRRWVARASSATVAAVLVMAIISSVAEPVSAHFWYPKTCCNDQDCFRATAVQRLPDGRLRIDAGHITVFVPRGFAIRPSQDNDPHVCVYRDIRGHYQPRCVFLPGLG